jgi:DNA-binding NtrC family response regulator
MPRLLIVEPEDVHRRALEAAASPLVDVESHGDFETARTRLRRSPFAFVVANVRIGAFNGLNLVYLGAVGPQAPRAIVYSEDHDPWLVDEVHRAGAFYEIASCLPVTMAAYLAARLPPQDRRNPFQRDRRQVFRGGRRCWDQHLTNARVPEA